MESPQTEQPINHESLESVVQVQTGWQDLENLIPQLESLNLEHIPQAGKSNPRLINCFGGDLSTGSHLLLEELTRSEIFPTSSDIEAIADESARIRAQALYNLHYKGEYLAERFRFQNDQDPEKPIQFTPEEKDLVREAIQIAIDDRKKGLPSFEDRMRN